jgi:hypothetical protein
MRSGTRSECKRRWTPQGYRPACKLKLGYEYLYLYAALNPYSGQLFSLLLPDMTKDSFALFNMQFCGWLNEVYGVDEKGNRKQAVLLIADGAGAHQSNICEGCGIKLVKLPPVSPELNPVERFFEELRKQLANHVFDTIKQLEDFLIHILKKYYDNPETIISITQYPYIRLPI